MTAEPDPEPPLGQSPEDNSAENPAISVQYEYDGETPDEPLPTPEQLSTWCTLAQQTDRGDVTIRLVGSDESQQLNEAYRGKDKPTNVLSFPADLPDELRLILTETGDTLPLGDLVLCVPVVVAEAVEQGKPLLHHFAHLVIHGTLHLRGYDHIEPAEATDMEALECTLLAMLAIPNPYETELSGHLE